MKKFSKLLILLSVCAILVGCAGAAMAASVEKVSQKYVKSHVGKTGYVLVDVRVAEVYNGKSPRKGIPGGHIAGAINFPLANLDSKTAEKELEAAGITKDKMVIVYCNTGRKSNKFAKALLKMGYPKVVNYKGGVFEWSKDDANPMEPKNS